MLGRNSLGALRSSLIDRPQRLFLTPLVAGLVLTTTVSSLAQVACKPLLSVRNVREIRTPIPPIVPWTWKASVVADTRFCATRSGSFEIDFVRIKEYGPDMQFSEKLRWSVGQFDVSVELTFDEGIIDYRIGFVAPCVCREYPDID